MSINTQEVKLNGERFVLLPKVEFEKLKRQAAGAGSRAAPGKQISAAKRAAAKARRAIALLDQWAGKPDTLGDVYWDAVAADVSANRLKFRAPAN